MSMLYATTPSNIIYFSFVAFLHVYAGCYDPFMCVFCAFVQCTYLYALYLWSTDLTLCEFASASALRSAASCLLGKKTSTH